MLLDSFQRALVAQGRSERTVDAYSRAIRILSEHSGKDFDSDLLTAQDVWSLIEDRSYWSQSYLKQIVAGAKAWHRWGHSRDLWALNGIASIPSPTVAPKRLPPLPLERVLFLLRRAETVRERKLVTLGFYGGLRIEEMSRVDGDSVEGDKLTFLGKGSRKRSIPIHPLLDLTIICYPSTRRQMKAAHERLRARCPFDWTPHSLRRTFAQRHLDLGTPVPAVEYFLGHTQKSTTLRFYAELPWPRCVSWMNCLHYGREQLELFGAQD